LSHTANNGDVGAILRSRGDFVVISMRSQAISGDLRDLRDLARSAADFGDGES